MVIGVEAGQPDGQGTTDAPNVLVNDIACAARSSNANPLLHAYDVPPEAFSDGEHVIEVVARGDGDFAQVRISRVEFIVDRV